MCYHEVEKYDCGHEEKHLIPCEALCEAGSCKKPEEDHQNDAGPKCVRCKEDTDEAEYMEEELRKLAMQESLQPSAAPPRTRDPNAPKLYFKRCIVWTRCGHHSHPRSSDIERDEADPEYLHVEGRGNCFECSAAAPSTIALMKERGNYQKEDPWGAMSRVEVAEGSSRQTALPSLEEIGQGLTHAETTAQNKERIYRSLSPSPDRSHTESDSDDSEDHTGLAKGKGRSGEPLVQPPHQITAESDESEDEAAMHHPSSTKGKHGAATFEEEDDEELESEDGSDEESEGENKGRSKAPNWSIAPHLPGEAAHGKPKMKGKEEEDGDDYESSSKSDDEHGHEHAGPPKTKAADPPSKS
ncbi:MAG: hypothetical protein Q9222_003512 [Ikaeria aurantiellina]